MFCHIDADSFFASVLLRKNPQYRGKPLIALGMGGSSVIAATYDVKSTGVRTGMRLTEAKKLCPNAIAVPSDFRETGVASKQIESILQLQSPLIEQMSIDEWFIGLQGIVGGTPKNLVQWALDVQTKVKLQTHITVSIGIAPTKLLAKMASEYHKPAGVTVITEQPNNKQYECTLTYFLQDRPIGAIPGFGSKRQTHAEVFNWQSAWDFCHADKAICTKLLGRPGLEMQQELLGTSIHPIITETNVPKSISRARSFKANYNKELAVANLFHHISYTVLKLRRHALMCQWVYVSVRNNRYEQKSKDYRLPMPMDTEQQLLPYIVRLFYALYDPQKGVTQVSLTLGHLKPVAAKQFSLFEDPTELVKDDEMQKSIDTVHKKFGRDAIMRGSALPIKSGVKRGLVTWN